MFDKNLKRFQRYCSSKALLFVSALLLTSNVCFASDSIEIKTASFSFHDETYLLNARINYSLSEEAIDALKNGVHLTFNVDLSIIEPRKWAWDKHHHNISLAYQIKYHTLAKTYQISDMTNNIQHNFSSLEVALHALGTLKDIPIHAISPPSNFNADATLKAYLNIEALPLPMRPLAYITPGWHLKSNTFQWPLQP
jgi:uncharacterized protein YfiM (DUF2279 family)